MASAFITHAGTKALSQVLLALYHEPLGVDPVATLMRAIDGLLPSSWISVDEVNTRNHTYTHRGGLHMEALANPDIAVHDLLGDHPGVQDLSKRGFSPVQVISDYVTLRQFRQTGLYEWFRTGCHWRDQVALVARVPGGVLGFAINRDKRFTLEERTLLEMLQPHVEAILARCPLYSRLPALACLTPREREVLHWMQLAKRDGEISIIMGVSSRTVHAHVRNILKKLGVDNRTAAVIMLMECGLPGNCNPLPSSP